MADDPDALRAQLVEMAAPVVADHGAELVDIEIAGTGTYSVRVLVHRDGGVDVVLCTEISREVADLFDVEDPIPGRYRLEVTSPGLDRPLQSDGDFRRAENRLLKVVTAQGRTLTGRLKSFTPSQIVLEHDGGEQAPLERADIAKATVEVEF